MDRNAVRLCQLVHNDAVALRKESVDRNGLTEEQQDTIIVALRKESVDRNMCSGCSGSLRWVALRKESVDRNCGRRCPIAAPGGRSPQGERG